MDRLQPADGKHWTRSVTKCDQYFGFKIGWETIYNERIVLKTWGPRDVISIRLILQSKSTQNLSLPVVYGVVVCLCAAVSRVFKHLCSFIHSLLSLFNLLSVEQQSTWFIHSEAVFVHRDHIWTRVQSFTPVHTSAGTNVQTHYSFFLAAQSS